jgi:hypothetical protein
VSPNAWRYIAIVYFVLAFCFMVFSWLMVWHARRKLKRAQQAAGSEVLRRIIAAAPCEDGRIVSLECGHEIHIVMHLPRSVPCPFCQREISDLKQMAGEK